MLVRLLKHMREGSTHHIFAPPIRTRHWMTFIPPLIVLLAIPVVIWLSGGLSDAYPEPEAIIVFAFMALLTLAIVVSIGNSTYVESVTLDDDNITLRTVNRQITVPWTSILVRRLPPQFDSIPIQLNTETLSGKRRKILLRVSLVQARKILEHPSCPKFKLKKEVWLSLKLDPPKAEEE